MPRKTLVKNGYLPRLVDEQIERYLEVFGAVEVAGTKWCGKTWTALAHAQSVSYVDVKSWTWLVPTQNSCS